MVLVGHEHDYERFAPQTPDQTPDTRGIREFVVGIGGRSFYTFSSVQPNSEARITQQFGVLKLTLHGSSYSWELRRRESLGPRLGNARLARSQPRPMSPCRPPSRAQAAPTARVSPAVVAAELERRSCDHDYNIYRGTASGAETLLTQVGNVTSYTDSTVTNGTTYFYEVSAVNAVGEGAALERALGDAGRHRRCIVSDQFERTVASGFGTRRRRRRLERELDLEDEGAGRRGRRLRLDGRQPGRPGVERRPSPTTWSCSGSSG